MWQIETLYFHDWLDFLVGSARVCHYDPISHSQRYNCEQQTGHKGGLCTNHLLCLIKRDVHITHLRISFTKRLISTEQFSFFL